MIYVSLPVHEKFDVVASQLKNFKKYLPNAIVVIHLSREAPFSIKELDGFLKLCKLNNYIVNPVQVGTGWGNIICAHLENIAFASCLDDAKKMVFHSSGDMLVRDRLADFLHDREYLFHCREIFPDSYWWPANEALKDLPFTDWLAVLGGVPVIASQLEGSMYPMDFLREFVERLKYGAALTSSANYPREEFFFSSFARSLNIVPDDLPYVFSEVHRFDRRLWSYYATYPFLLRDDSYLTKRFRKGLVNKLLNARDYGISFSDIEAIRKQDVKYFEDSQYMSDGANLWHVHNVNNLFGVKRVPRVMTNKIRQYLSEE